MVLPLKRWKSRSSPGFEGGARRIETNPFTLPKTAVGADRLRKADRPPELMRGKPSERMLAPAIEAYKWCRGVEQPGSSSGS